MRVSIKRVVSNVVVQISRVRIEQRDLPLDRFDHSRMTMTHQRNVVVAVEKRPSRFIVKILPPAPHDVHRPVIAHAEILAKKRAARRRQRLGRPGGTRKPILRNADQAVRIRRKSEPFLALARVRDAWKTGSEIQKIRDDLEMQMRRPVAIRRRRSDLADSLPLGHRAADFEAVEGIERKMPVQREKNRRCA